MRTVRHYARRYRNTPLGYEDAVGEGYLSLAESVARYDDSRGVPFVPYACQNVLWAMSSAHRGAGTRKRNMTPVELAVDREFFEEIEDQNGLNVDLLSLSQSVKKLDDQHMAVLAMRVAGYSRDEMAETLGVDATRISQLRKEIRRDVFRG
jgi:RNA polymerase sigma factor (sigma-70 family)